MPNTLYGSTHTHFESQYDTGNDLGKMLRRFLASGAKKIAATEHGVFSSYEDLRDIASKMRKKGETIKKVLDEKGIELPASDGAPADAEFIESLKWKKPDVPDKELEYMMASPETLMNAARLVNGLDGFDVVPGVEGYFGDSKAHLILIAKDYEGYVSLCKVISEANELLRDTSPKKGVPIITMENLQKNISKGHVMCTSACIAGPFGQLFGLEKANVEEKIHAIEADFEKTGYTEMSEFVEHYESQNKHAKDIKIRKYEMTEAERAIRKNNDYTLFDALEQRRAEEVQITAWLNENKVKYETTLAKIKELGKGAYATKAGKLEKLKDEYAILMEKLNNGSTEEEAENLYKQFIDVFGRDDFFFELQNHGLQKEADIYGEVVRFAYRMGHTNFIASNDVHVGARKTDPEYESLLKRRNVSKFMRFNSYMEESEDDKEYVIKSDNELYSELLKIIPDVRTPDGKFYPKARTIASAIGNIEMALSQCDVQFPKNEKHYPLFCADENAEFERKVRAGIKERFPDGFPSEDYEKRLEYELEVIKNMGYAGYHLIVADYLEYGRLLGYLPTEEEIANAPENVEELRAYIEDRGYPMIGYNIGPGRGSGAGSLCCYCLGITDIDPMPYNLLFERFLNVERVSMPDIDSDFRTDIRDKVVDYCRTRYGKECICQIMTKQYAAPKGSLRLAARYLGNIAFLKGKAQDVDEDIDVADMDVEDVDMEALENTNAEAMLASEKNEDLKTFMKDWYNRADKLAKEYDMNGDYPESYRDEVDESIVKLAKQLDGMFTSYGQHAAGTIISGDDVREILPLMWNSKKGSMETQCTMAQAEAKGLLKMDFLGLGNLDIITDILRNPSAGVLNHLVDNVYKTHYMDGKYDTTLQNYKFRDEMLKDPAIYRDIFSTGLTQGVFQFESPGMKNMLVRFHPETFEDIILLVAAYRPGPMQYLDEIIAQKNHDDWEAKKPWALGDEPPKPTHSINIDNDTLNNILAPTYGCIIYQEQVMQIFQHLAGYSLGGADLVRRAMSKKHLEDLVPERAAFINGDPERGIEGCVKKQGISAEEANLLFDQMMDFASYAFNKSHATAYALVAMFTAYLKEYHTADFFRTSINYVKKQDEIPGFVQEFSSFGLSLAGPSLAESEDKFSVEADGKTVRYGLQYVKGFSSQAGVIRKSTVQEFIEANPNMSLKVVEKYAMLGLFTGAWQRDLKRGRCLNNRHEHIRWIKENGDLFKTYQKYIAKLEELQDNLASVKAKLEALPEGESDERTSLMKEAKALNSSIEKYTVKRKTAATELNTKVQFDMANRGNIIETTEDVLENRKWETDLLSIPFDIQSSMEALKYCKNKRTFEALKMTVDENGGGKSIMVPAIVLSVSEAKRTKSSGNVYYDVTLMDRNSNIVVRRFDEKPNILQAEFSLPLNENKFFTCRMKNTRYIARANDTGKGYVPFNASTQEKVNELAKGAVLKTIPIDGNRTVTVCTKAPEEDLSEEKEERD